MSGLPEIIQWVRDEVFIREGEDARRVYDDISEIFENDGRLPLDSILGADKPQFMKFLEKNVELSEVISMVIPDITEERITQAMVALFG